MSLKTLTTESFLGKNKIKSHKGTFSLIIFVYTYTTDLILSMLDM